jgi:hypothetical protein
MAESKNLAVYSGAPLVINGVQFTPLAVQKTSVSVGKSTDEEGSISSKLATCGTDRETIVSILAAMPRVKVTNAKKIGRVKIKNPLYLSGADAAKLYESFMDDAE